MEAAGFTLGDWREWRRLRALQLKHQGWRQCAIAEALGVSSVYIRRSVCASDFVPGWGRTLRHDRTFLLQGTTGHFETVASLLVDFAVRQT
jgi:hypothetical protein